MKLVSYVAGGAADYGVVSGDGVIGTMLSKLVQARLKPLEGRKFAVLAFSLGQITLRDLNIRAQDDLLAISAMAKAIDAMDMLGLRNAHDGAMGG